VPDQVESLPFFNPFGETRVTANRLPHWQQKGAVYFVTFRLADSLPAAFLKNWDQERARWLRQNPEPWSVEKETEYHTRFSGAIERALDAGHGSCLLRRADCRSVVSDALGHFAGERYLQLSFVVMPNHIHALFILNREWLSEKAVRSWKSFPARR
jgi:putative transposase